MASSLDQASSEKFAQCCSSHREPASPGRFHCYSGAGAHSPLDDDERHETHLIEHDCGNKWTLTGYTMCAERNRPMAMGQDLMPPGLRKPRLHLCVTDWEDDAQSESGVAASGFAHLTA
jgi:hypothetical protein